MKKQYSNIFFHEGVRAFTEKELTSRKFLDRLEHLENDVTKSFLIVLQNLSDHKTKELIKKIFDVDLEDEIDYIFQVRNKSYSNIKNRIMVVIKSNLTPNYKGETKRISSIPDAALKTKETVLLIEVKTQSCFDKSQVEHHINQYLGSKTDERTIFWEDIYEILRQENSLSEKENFLINSFADFLELIHLNRFNGFNENDFDCLNPNENDNPEEVIQRQYVLKTKLRKMLKDIQPSLGAELEESKLGRLETTGKEQQILWCGYFLKTKGKEYPNLNFNINSDSLEIHVNAENKTQFRQLNTYLMKNQEGITSKIANINPKPYLELYTKLPLTVESQNKFYWKPQKEVQITPNSIQSIHDEIENVKQNYKKYKEQMLQEMKKQGLHTQYAKKNNKTPLFVLRITYKLNKDQAITLSEKITPHLTPIIEKFTKIIIETKYGT